jgi:hypothetical protein
MELKRSFIFHGNASAFGGRLIHPVDIVLENSCASSLAVVGGRWVSRLGPQRFGDEVSFESASTFAEGLYDDARQYEALTFQRVPADVLTTTTRVNAEVRGLSVGLKPKLTVARVHAAFNSTSPAGGGETPAWPTDDSTIENLAIDGYRLIVELNLPLFQRYNTRSKLLAAADDPEFVREYGDCFFMRSPFEGRTIPPTGRLIGCEYIHATIVRAIRWDGPPFPGAQIDQNLVVVPNFGRIFIGELLITAGSKRLTMLRLELGSPQGGAIACASIENNGGWSP